MSRRYRTWREAEVERLRDHPEDVPLYLDIAFEEAEKDGNWGAFMAALRTVAEARGGLGDLAEKLECSRPNLYKTLSEEGNPRLDTFGAILHELGLRLSFQPSEHSTITDGS